MAHGLFAMNQRASHNKLEVPRRSSVLLEIDRDGLAELLAEALANGARVAPVPSSATVLQRHRNDFRGHRGEAGCGAGRRRRGETRGAGEKEKERRDAVRHAAGAARKQT